MSDWRSEAGRKGAAARKTRANQYTAGSRVNVEDMRARIKVGILLAKLENDAIGKINLSDGQRASIKLLLDKAIPTLQAVETSHTEPAINRSEHELYADIRAIISAHPHLVQQILGQNAAQQHTLQAVESTSDALPQDDQAAA